VWIPSNIKERVKAFIPAELVEKIPTEKDIQNLDQLKGFLEEKKHPVVARWEAVAAEKVVEEKKEVVEGAPVIMPTSVTAMPIAGGGFKLILKDAKIVAKKVIIRSVKKEG
jgi:acetyl-CoA decarbonylase/synthase complex subunit beta